MKKLALTVGSLLLASVAFAGVNAPTDRTGQTLPTIDFVGADSYRINAASSTNAFAVATKPGMVYGVVVSSCAITNYIVLRDSATANTTSTPLLTVWCEDSGADEDGVLIFNLPAPIKFNNGLSVNMNAALTGAGEAVVLYRTRSATE